ncbi:Transcription termination factor MTERF5, chloroplastic [Glycine max]|nr:Transcription termination factor MTERF5, chloroplastic [Glycine max]
MKTFTSIQTPHHFPCTPFFSHFAKRTQLSFPAKVFFCQAKSGIDGSLNLEVVSPTLLAAEKEEAKAVLTLFLKKQGLSNSVAARTINKSDLFIDHLVSKLHSKHKSWYLAGRELTTLEIRDSLIPYLESLFEEHGDLLVDVVENYPNPPVKDKSDVPVPPSSPVLDSKKLKAVSRVSAMDPDGGNLRPHIVYLMELGMDIEQIRSITRRFPSFAYYSLEGKIKPVVEFFLELGVPKEHIPTILSKRPQLCGISLSENLKPAMKFLESLGVDKKQWPKVIYRFPALLTYSRQKVMESIDFLHEFGLSEESIGKILTRCPNIVSYSVEDNLRPTANYFCSLGVDVGILLFRCPQNFGLSIEANLKPITTFFLERGYTLEEIGTMISRYGALYTFSLTENLIPKWDFFLTTGYQKSDLVKFPQYFGYSLEERIKPRFVIMKKSGVKLLLNQVLSLSSSNFEEALKKKMKKMQNAKLLNPSADENQNFQAVFHKVFLEKILNENHGLPCFCHGHSTGAAITLKALLDPKVEASIVGATFTSPAVGVEPSHPILVALAPIVSFLLPTYQCNSAYKKGLPVSRDPDALIAKYSDPLVCTGSLRVLLHADSVTDPDASQKLYEQASSTDKTIKLYEGFAHDLLFEPKREDITRNIIQWLNSRI